MTENARDPDALLALVLHAHLPYVRHPEHEDFLEERWFFEAVAETYLPLLRVFERLEDDGVDYGAALSLSPTLLAMFNDELLRDRCARHLAAACRLADRQADRRAGDPAFGPAARFHAGWYRDALHAYELRYRRDLAGAFGRLAAGGRLELFTSAATHGLLPLLDAEPGAVAAQLRTGAEYFASVFGFRPEGLWLPECAYAEGLEREIAAAGFRYAFVDSHAVERANPAPRRGIHAPVAAPNGVLFFARDRETSHQVWAAEVGYPGHPDYREFYRDLGWELPLEELGDFVVAGHIRTHTGLKYHRVTGPGERKDPYDPARARQVAADHAADFQRNREKQAAWLRARLDRPALVCAMYDAELFGHWWFEGPWFLDYAFRRLAYDGDRVKALTPRRYLERFPDNQAAVPAASSWGKDGAFEFWRAEANADIWPGLHQAARRMRERAEALLAGDAARVWRAVSAPEGGQGGLDDGREARILKQMMRELLLAQASDWPFIIRTGTSPEYARRRLDGHLSRFWRLDGWLARGESFDVEARRMLAAYEEADRLFPDCDPRRYAAAPDESE